MFISCPAEVSQRTQPKNAQNSKDILQKIVLRHQNRSKYSGIITNTREPKRFTSKLMLRLRWRLQKWDAVILLIKCHPKGYWGVRARPCVRASLRGEVVVGGGGLTALCSEYLQQRSSVLRCGEVATEDCCGLPRGTTSR